MKNKKHGLTLKRRGALYGYAFISIWIIGFFVFVLYPVIYSMILSVNAIKIRPEGIIYTFKGTFFYNYALNELPHFRNCLAVQLRMVCGMTPVILVLSLIIAMLLNGKFRGRALFRAIFFMPVIIMSGPVISSLLSQYTVDFSTNSRIVYDLLSYMPSALASPVEYVLNNLVKILWMSGVQILIFLAGLQSIGSEVYEAASIDGATPSQQLKNITIPMMASSITINVITTTIAAFKAYELPYLISKGLPGHSTLLITQRIFFFGFQAFDYGRGSALSVVLLLIIALISLVQLVVLRKREDIF